MSELQDEQVKDEVTKIQRSGEYKMLTLLFIIFAALFADSLRVEGIYQGRSNGPGSIPQIVCTIMLILVAVQAAVLWRQGYQEGTLRDVVKHLFNKDVLILFVMVVLYGLLVETLTFVPTSIIFLIAAMYFLERTHLVKKVVISVSVVACLYVIFSTIFQVVLP